MILKVYRFDPSTGRTRYDHFEMKPRSGMTVLSALFHVQDRLDDSLAFRYSCRGAVCGTCAVLVNKVPRLACRTQLQATLDDSNAIEITSFPAIEGGESWNRREEILIEPLPNFHVIRDLIVDHRKFFRSLREVRPTFRPPAGAPDKESRMEPDAVRELEKYTNCILCAACYAACPVNGKNPEYPGPAALARLYRFAIDPRETGSDARMETANSANGWWACEFFKNCRQVCPKGVPPNLGIGNARARLTTLGRKPPEAPGTVALTEPLVAPEAPVTGSESMPAESPTTAEPGTTEFPPETPVEEPAREQKQVEPSGSKEELPATHAEPPSAEESPEPAPQPAPTPVEAPPPAAPPLAARDSDSHKPAEPPPEPKKRPIEYGR